MVLVWFVVFISCFDDKLEVTNPKTPPPGALVANGPKFEIYHVDEGFRYLISEIIFFNIININCYSYQTDPYGFRPLMLPH